MLSDQFGFFSPPTKDGSKTPEEIKALEESERLNDLARYKVLGAGSHPRLERVARVIQRTLSAKYVSISMLPDTGAGIERIANINLPERRIIRCKSFTEVTVKLGGPLVIPNLVNDKRFATHPLVTDSPRLRSVLSVPLLNARGRYLGAVYIADDQPRDYSAEDISLLSEFSHIVLDELELHRTLIEARNREQVLETLFDNAAVGIALINDAGNRIAINTHYCDMLGYSRSELLGTHVHETTHPDDRDAASQLSSKLQNGEVKSYHYECRAITKSGGHLWVRKFVSRMSNSETSEPYRIAIVENINSQRKSEDARDILLGEINHRVKNTLAIIQGIAKQLLRNIESPSEFGPAFEARVQALAKSHDMLTEHNWHPLPMRRLVEQLVTGAWEPYLDQVKFDAPQTVLNAQTTVMLTLVLNELMTNAVKHGALKSSTGTVTIDCHQFEKEGVNWLELQWRESTPNQIQIPEKRGLGLYLIERAPRLGLGGEGESEFAPDGFRSRIAFPVYGASTDHNGAPMSTTH